MASEAQRHFYAGLIFLQQNDLDKAENAFKAVLEIKKESSEALVNLGVIALRRNLGQLAIYYFTQALCYTPDHIEARNNLAATFIHHDLFENALSHYNILLEKFPREVEYLYNAGVAEMALGHLSKAMTHFENILQQDAKHFATLQNCAAIAMKLRKREEATNFLQTALSINPTDEICSFMLNALAGNTDPKTCNKYVKNLFDRYALYYDSHMHGALKYQLPAMIINILTDALHKKSGHITSISSSSTAIPAHSPVIPAQAGTHPEIGSESTLGIDSRLRGNDKEVNGNDIKGLESDKVKKILQFKKTLDLGCGTGLSGLEIREFTKHLTGVDISTKMLEKAQLKNIYDELVEQDMLEYLSNNQQKFDLIICLDALPYIGDLAAWMSQIADHLADEGIVIFSCEISLEKSWKLDISARFSHNPDYVKNLLQVYNLKLICKREVPARIQEDQPLFEIIYCAQK